MNRRLGIALSCGLATLLWGCTRPCTITADCGGSDVCSAAICRSLTCEEAIFAIDPSSGQCVPLSGCFLTPEQRGWLTCSDNPCGGLAEPDCIVDRRCQPIYIFADGEAGTLTGDRPSLQFTDPDIVSTPGVSNGEQPKHGYSGSVAISSRKYGGCRAAPRVTPQPPCSTLAGHGEQCRARADCIYVRHDTDLCYDRHTRQSGCSSVDALSCLTNPDCQPIGTSCYCPPGASCACSGGTYLDCEANDHLRRCATSADCSAGERCDNDEDCVMPRTYEVLPELPRGPGTPGCLGTCVPSGCAGLGEKKCNADPSCNGGSYGTVCRPQTTYYCTASRPDGQGNGPGAAAVGLCGCGTEYVSCAEQESSSDLRVERSLLVRDPEIVDDPAFNLLAVLTRLAPAGNVDGFTQSLLSQVGATEQVASGAVTMARVGFGQLYKELDVSAPQLARRFAAMMATTALINRLDLATTGSCGEARISYAMTSAYANGNQRMTLIVELTVPDDGNQCRTVAQKWAELSLISDVEQRRTKLVALYAALLSPKTLGQIRTNEFVNRTGLERWELRELHLRPADGLLALAPVAQTVDPLQTGSAALLAWVGSNLAGLKAGTALIPQQFLAGASTEDGGRLDLRQLSADPAVVRDAEGALNKLACAGCHLTETQSPFVHIGERLASKVNYSYKPIGRAVIDEYLQRELPKRATMLRSVLFRSDGLTASDWRPRTRALVH